MATFKEIKKLNDVYICDECKKDIKSTDIILVEACDNVNIITPMMPFVFVDKRGVVVSGGKMAELKLGDQLLACPHCKTPHLYGFDIRK